MTDFADVPAEQRSPGDICVCGDARRSHRDGTMECLLHDLCTPSRCLLFRLCWTAAEAAANEADFQRRVRAQMDGRKA